MAKVTVLLNGAKIAEQILDPAQECVIGRGSGSDIILDSSELSRQHAKISFDGKNWICQIVSRYGQIIINGAGVTSVSLADGSAFQIPPYEIKFESSAEISSPSSISDSVTTPLAAQLKETDNSDKTRTGITNLKSVIYRLNENAEAIEEITLGEGLIEAGRSRSCQVRLKDEKASRKHFKMENDGKQTVLTDLGSHHQTFVNGTPVTVHVLQSGDEIQVGEEKFKFEYVNPMFEDLPDVASEISENLSVGESGGSESTEPAVIKYTPDQMPAIWQQQPQAPGPYALSVGQNQGQANPRKKKSPALSLLIMGFLGFIIYVALSGDLKNKSSDRQVASNPSPKSSEGSQFDKLSGEQKKYLEDTYNLAMNLYTSGKYDLAALEIDKILRIIPNYKDARNIQALAQQALEIKKQKDESDRQQREQDTLTHKVNDLLDDCDKLLNQKRYLEVESCVSKISDLDPNNPRAQSLIASAKVEIARKARNKEYVIQQAHRKAQAQATFNKAQKELNQKRYQSAIGVFEKVQNMTFNDTDGLKQKSKIGIQTAHQKIVESSDSAFREGKSAFEAKDYKKSIYKMMTALKLYSQNGDAKIIKEKAENELHIEMKNIYSESVIDENLGNTESAKKKWKQILDQDTTFDSYYQKAKMKLGKYEK